MGAAEAITSSTPGFSQFDPTVIPYQDQVIDDVLCGYDYGLGVHEILLSGSVGSAKSILMAHLIIRHCLEFSGARAMLGRKAMPDLKRTIFAKVVEHLANTPSLVKGRDYWINETQAAIRFRNKSEIISTSWHDRDFAKVRSLEVSAVAIEELTENDDRDKQAYLEIKLRVGRLPHIPQNWIISATNPDSPAHWAYEYFELHKDEGLLDTAKDRTPTKHVYYSVTTDNPFLPSWYVEQLLKDLDPKMAERMVKGRWVDISSEGIYHQYDRSNNYRDDAYAHDPGCPLILTWDFNIGEGKPLSVGVCQYLPDDTFHVFGEAVVEGMRTEDSCDELAGRGYLDLEGNPAIVVCGDATGRSRDTRSKRSDYEIIEGYLANYVRKDGQRLRFQLDVPRANPPVRERHNKVNAYLCNAVGAHRLFVYKGAPTADKALRLTRLKPGGTYIEDDSKAHQHLGTALGYALMARTASRERKPQATIIL